MSELLVHRFMVGDTYVVKNFLHRKSILPGSILTVFDKKPVYPAAACPLSVLITRKGKSGKHRLETSRIFAFPYVMEEEVLCGNTLDVSDNSVLILEKIEKSPLALLNCPAIDFLEHAVVWAHALFLMHSRVKYKFWPSSPKKLENLLLNITIGWANDPGFYIDWVEPQETRIRIINKLHKLRGGLFGVLRNDEYRYIETQRAFLNTAQKNSALPKEAIAACKGTLSKGVSKCLI